MKATLSPGSMPAATNPFASSITWRWNSAAVMSRQPAPSGTANRASDGVARTRSTSRSAMLAFGSAGTTAGTSNWTAALMGRQLLRYRVTSR